MEKELGVICAEGLSFFSKTSRLISHELKNVLAIISETTGLLDELVALFESGRQLEPGKLHALSEGILEEIERANDIVRNMNTFAHGVDEFFGETDVGQAVELMIRLVQMDTPGKNAAVDFSKTGRHVVYTSRFFLENLIYDAITHALTYAGPAKEIHISVESAAAGVRIHFSGLSTDDPEAFPSRKAGVIADALGADVSVFDSQGHFHIIVPEKLDDGLIRRLRFVD